MIQNSLDRLVEAIVSTLVEEVAPNVADPYVQAQVRAAAELVANIGTRVEWRRSYLEETTDRVMEIVELAASHSTPAELPRSHAALKAAGAGDGDAPDPWQARSVAFDALSEVQAWAVARDIPIHDTVSARIRAMLVWQLDDEQALMRTVMYHEKPAG